MYSKYLRIRRKNAGFSLIEVLISAAIIGIVTAIVVVKYGAFNSTVLLRNQAFEVALAVREAQVFSISVRRDPDTGFRDPYGISFPDEGTQQFSLFVDVDDDGYDESEEVERFTIDSRFSISALCLGNSAVTDPDSDSSCGASDLSITFKRPDFDANFDTSSGHSGEIATIRLVGINDDTIHRDIVVRSTGLISVE